MDRRTIERMLPSKAREALRTFILENPGMALYQVQDRFCDPDDYGHWIRQAIQDLWFEPAAEQNRQLWRLNGKGATQ
jgi:hypothetical protein